MISWHCVICGEIFTPSYPYQSTCSGDCEKEYDVRSGAVVREWRAAVFSEALEVLDAAGMEHRPGVGVVRKGARSGVYFVQSGQDGPIKIGVSGDVEKRMVELCVASPSELRLLAVIDGATDKDERALHVAFSDERLRGEWFEPSERVMDLIKRVNEGQ